MVAISQIYTYDIIAAITFLNDLFIYLFIMTFYSNTYFFVFYNRYLYINCERIEEHFLRDRAI